MIAGILACLNQLANWLTLRRIRAQAIILCICLWSVAAVDFSSHGLLDRAGNIKFQDFLVFYTSGKLVMQHRSDRLFDPQVRIQKIQTVVGYPTQVQLPAVYGPQVGLFFSFFSRLSFLSAAVVWTIISIVFYLLGCYWIWQCCPELYSLRWTIVLLILAFPPFFHFVVRGQLSSLVMLCFVAAFRAFQTKHEWLAGLALGSLVFKPQFLIGIVIVLLAARAWKNIGGILTGSLVQLGLSWAYFGTAVMRAYVTTLWHLPQNVSSLEPGVSQAQMHSLRSFWTLIFPWSGVSGIFYAISSIAVLYISAKAWKSSGPLALRFSILVLATVLVNPHLFIYDLLVLAPIFFLVSTWTVQHSKHSSSSTLKALLYFSFLLPLFGPIAIWTHVQLSVIAFVGLLIVLASILREEAAQTLSV
jgi:hypothetical protein